MKRIRSEVPADVWAVVKAEGETDTQTLRRLIELHQLMSRIDSNVIAAAGMCIQAIAPSEPVSQVFVSKEQIDEAKDSLPPKPWQSEYEASFEPVSNYEHSGGDEDF